MSYTLMVGGVGLTIEADDSGAAADGTYRVKVGYITVEVEAKGNTPAEVADKLHRAFLAMTTHGRSPYRRGGL